MKYEDLLSIAYKAKKNAYAPYSNFRVGAAVLTENNKVYTGVNIENASYGASNCAERTAIFKAISDGQREIKAIAISSDNEDVIYPCGICRQVIAEFGDGNTKIICSDRNRQYRVYIAQDLLPHAFKLQDHNRLG